MGRLLCSLLCLSWLLLVTGNDDSAEVVNPIYKSPVLPKSDHVLLSEHFDDADSFQKNWIPSKAKKGQSDGSVVNYDGYWVTEQMVNSPLPGDFGLVLKSKAKHAAISKLLNRKLDFKAPTTVIQYEVLFQDGQECGGAYLKLLSDDGSSMDLTKFHDLTPYTIMFGPDKCGNEHKLHFIFRHRNPRNGSLEEKHAKKPTAKLSEFFTDAKPHLYTLVIQSDNTFKVYVDHTLVNEGSLLTDFDPPVNPPAEIDDPLDKEPTDWDNKEKIPDPTAQKPLDWDEEAPATIDDPSAAMPDGWLEDEPTDIKDPTAEKPTDWDVEMDGEWEAPLVPNPACQSAPGCGPWTPPQIPNPNYKGKWYPPLVDNPNFKGKWTPRKISNPDYFEDKNPYRMTPIVAVGFELWSMSANILFDNILITDNEQTARDWAAQTFDIKKAFIEKTADSLVSRFFTYTNQNPWLWAVYIVLMLVPIILAVLFCFGTAAKEREEAAAALVRSKKFDEASNDEYEAATSEGTVEDTSNPPDVGDKEENLSVGGEEEAFKEGGLSDSEEEAEQCTEAEEIYPEFEREVKPRGEVRDVAVGTMPESGIEEEIDSKEKSDDVPKPEDEDAGDAPAKPATVRRRVRAD